MSKRISPIVDLIHEADTLLRKAIRRHSKNRRFVAKVVEAELLLDDAIALADPRQTIIKK